MDHRKLLQRCAAALMLAVAIRIVWVTDGDMLASLLLLTQTGRVVQGATTQTQPPQPDHFIPPTEITQPTDAEDAPEAVLSFSADDLGLFSENGDRRPGGHSGQCHLCGRVFLPGMVHDRGICAVCRADLL